MITYNDLSEWLKGLDVKYWDCYDHVWDMFNDLFDVIDPSCRAKYTKKMYAAIMSHMQAIIDRDTKPERP